MGELTCAGADGATSSALDWAHASSITTYTPSAGSQGNVPPLYVVSLRNINTVLALKQDMTGLEWILSPNSASSSIVSNFTFSNAGEEFFDVHSAQLVEEDTLILFD